MEINIDNHREAIRSGIHQVMTAKRFLELNGHGDEANKWIKEYSEKMVEDFNSMDINALSAETVKEQVRILAKLVKSEE